jgi:hypothetical protein
MRLLMLPAVLPWKVFFYLLTVLSKYVDEPPEDAIADAFAEKLATVVLITIISILITFIVGLLLQLKGTECCGCDRAKGCAVTSLQVSCQSPLQLIVLTSAGCMQHSACHAGDLLTDEQRAFAAGVCCPSLAPFTGTGSWRGR